MERSRKLLVEVQALVAGSEPNPRAPLKIIPITAILNADAPRRPPQ
jgi:hypothetical protein